jgi:hypothetical protein
MTSVFRRATLAWICIALSVACGSSPQTTDANDDRATATDVALTDVPGVDDTPAPDAPSDARPDGGGPVSFVALTAASGLVAFAAATPATTSAAVPVTGLAAGETLVGVDFRPSNGRLYGLGSGSRLYQIDRNTGVATLVGAAPFTPALAGTAFGMAFNPVADRVRVVSDAEQNLRINPDTGATAGVDTNLSPPGNLVAVAYVNAVAGATMTTLFGIDSSTDMLVRIGGPDGMPSPNGGIVSTVGALGVDTGALVGFDVAPANNAAFAVLAMAGGMSQLYSINLTTGAATLVGTIGGGISVRAIAVAP